MEHIEENTKDKILGCFYGVGIGDALGAPFEFKNAKPKIPYTGILSDETIEVKFQFQTMVIEPSSITDDTEMTLALLSSILQEKRYVKEKVIASYLKWANQKATPLGKNTRALMKGVTTLKGFLKRREKIMAPELESSQSNGSLMRCTPFILLKQWQKFSDIDVSITNDNEINRICSVIYISTIRCIIYDKPLVLPENIPDIIKKHISYALKGEIIDVSVNKGWVVYGIYVSLITMFSPKVNSYGSGMDFIAKHFIKGDTDTIMAITGGLLGSMYGFKSMTKEAKTGQNIIKLKGYLGLALRANHKLLYDLESGLLA